MTVAELVRMQWDHDSEPFEVTVQEPGKCMEYSCRSDNPTQAYDFMVREIYEISFSLRSVVCW